MDLRNQFKAALAERRQQIGYWCTMDGDAAIEIAACSGFDWLLFDTEHTPSSDREILRKLQVAAAYPVSPVVRPGWNDRVMIKRLLDIGAQSVLIPYVETGLEASEAVASTLYPPRGRRGVAGAMRASRYGNIPTYHATADDEICLIVQIESQAGLDNIEAIAGLDGVHGLFVGPSDLAANCGLTLPSDNARLRDIVDHALERIEAAGKPSGVLATVPADARHYLDRGATFVAVGVDATVLAKGSAELARQHKAGR